MLNQVSLHNFSIELYALHIVFKSVLLIALAFLVLNTVVDDRCECAMYISFTGFLVGFRSLTKIIVSF